MDLARLSDGVSESEAEQQFGAVADREVIAPVRCAPLAYLPLCRALLASLTVQFPLASVVLLVSLDFVPAIRSVCAVLIWSLCAWNMYIHWPAVVLCCVVLGRCKFVCLLCGALWRTICV